MFGRVRRAADAVADGQVLACGVLLTYSPETIAGVTAVGLGTAAFGGVGVVATNDGPRTGAGDAVSSVLEWGRREQRRFVRLPNRVLAVVTDDGVVLTPWYATGHDSRRLVHWRRGEFSATPVHYIGQRGVRVVSAGSAAILTARNGPLHRGARTAIDAIVSSGS